MTRHSFIATLMLYVVSFEHMPHEGKLTIAVVLPSQTTINIATLHLLFLAPQIEIHDDGSRSFSGTIKDQYFQKAFLEEYYLHGI